MRTMEGHSVVKYLSALAVGVIAGLLSVSQAPAQVADGKAIDYPQRAVQIIVPFAPGGPTDVTARLIAQKLTQNLGQNFVVENQPGAGATRGLRNLLRAEADGYTFAFTAVGPIKEGKLRALALTSEERSSALPDTPTIVEAGFPDQVALTLQGIVSHSATPKPIVEFLNREIRKAFAEPDILSKLIEIGYSPVTTTTEEFAARAKSEIDRWAKLIKNANIKPVN